MPSFLEPMSKFEAGDFDRYAVFGSLLFEVQKKASQYGTEHESWKVIFYHESQTHSSCAA